MLTLTPPFTVTLPARIDGPLLNVTLALITGVLAEIGAVDVRNEIDGIASSVLASVSVPAMVKPTALPVTALPTVTLPCAQMLVSSVVPALFVKLRFLKRDVFPFAIVMELATE